MTNGKCDLCSGKTSAKKTKKCRKCYTLYNKEQWKQKNYLRDSIILKEVASGMRASHVAKKHNLTREGIRVIIKRHKFNYQDLLSSR